MNENYKEFSCNDCDYYNPVNGWCKEHQTEMKDDVPCEDFKQCEWSKEFHANVKGKKNGFEPK